VENSNFAEVDPRAPRSPHGLLYLNLISGSNFGVRDEAGTFGFHLHRRFENEVDPVLRPGIG
jgi:hypothetical protein